MRTRRDSLWMHSSSGKSEFAAHTMWWCDNVSIQICLPFVHVLAMLIRCGLLWMCVCVFVCAKELRCEPNIVLTLFTIRSTSNARPTVSPLETRLHCARVCLASGRGGSGNLLPRQPAASGNVALHSIQIRQHPSARRTMFTHRPICDVVQGPRDMRRWCVLSAHHSPAINHNFCWPPLPNHHTNNHYANWKHLVAQSHPIATRI